MNLTGTDLHAALYVAAEVIRSRQRTGQPVPTWLRRHFNRLDTEIRRSRDMNPTAIQDNPIKSS